MDDHSLRAAWFETSREARRRVTVCELCHNSHPVIIFGPPSVIIRRVWASLGIRPESVGNPARNPLGIRPESAGNPSGIRPAEYHEDP